MGRVGSCFENAAAEATFSTTKVEYVHRRQFRTRVNDTDLPRAHDTGHVGA
ncbi:hypothetical protein ACPPVO_02060 [Dactylosporangium sp. McL0621]|uniref:hypothetical protein n=1 Tax=Dactylosporangium sp. McL0621 TaxID=3415678 RepID=UPI003CF44339